MDNKSEILSIEDEFDANQSIARSRFGDMLHDTERNQKYYKGLECAIKKMHQRGLPAKVLDIGTGTGLLSMMAVKLGADSVVACDGFLPAVECAAKIIEANGMKDKIKLIKKHSTQIVMGVDMEQRANILVTEVFDTELIGEGAIETFNHAHKNLLEKDCIVVPTSATMYVQLVESPLVSSWNKIKLIPNLDGEVLIKPPNQVDECQGEVTLHDIQLNQLSENSFRALTEPVPVFEFDFSGKEPLAVHRKGEKIVKCTQTGLLQGIFMWWDLQMDVDNEVILSCAPYWAHPDTEKLVAENPKESPQHLIPWRDHWIQAIYYPPQSNTLLYENNEIKIISYHDEFSLWFEVSNRDTLVLNQRPSCTCGLHLITPRCRIMQINDSLRIKKFVTHLEDAWNLKNASLLVLGSGSLIGLAASKLEPCPSKVIVIESNRILKGVMEEFVDYNKLWNVNIKENCDKIKLSTVTHVLYEPSSVAAFPWTDFNYFSFVHKNMMKLGDKVKYSPCKAKLQAIPVRFRDLHKIREPLKECEGFDMKKYDEMILPAIDMADPTIEVHFLWEYPCEAVGNTSTLLEIDVSKLELKYETTGSMDVQNANGIAIWIDWYLNESPKSVISTGPTQSIDQGEYISWSMHNRQGVYFVTNSDSNSISYKVTYQLDSNELEINFK